MILRGLLGFFLITFGKSNLFRLTKKTAVTVKKPNVAPYIKIKIVKNKVGEALSGEVTFKRINNPTAQIVATVIMSFCKLVKPPSFIIISNLIIYFATNPFKK